MLKGKPSLSIDKTLPENDMPYGEWMVIFELRRNGLANATNRPANVLLIKSFAPMPIATKTTLANPNNGFVS